MRGMKPSSRRRLAQKAVSIVASIAAMSGIDAAATPLRAGGVKWRPK
jgi:hypothetical protein